MLASCFTVLISQAVAQTTDTTNPSVTPPPLIIRWMRYHGAINQWGEDPYHGSLTINTKTANVPPTIFRPRVTVDAFWSNQRPFPATKPTEQGEYSFTSYNARLVTLLSIKKQVDYKVDVTGIWNFNKIQTTTQFDQNGARIHTVRDITPVVTLAKGQLLISSDWKTFTLSIDGVNTLKGVEINMMTTTNPINPFTSGTGAMTNIKDLMGIMGGFRAIPGFSNYNPDLDCNKDSIINLADLTTVAANM